MIELETLKDIAVKIDNRSSEYENQKQFIESLGVEDAIEMGKFGQIRSVHVWAWLAGLGPEINRAIDENGSAAIEVPEDELPTINFGMSAWVDGFCIGLELGRNH